MTVSRSRTTVGWRIAFALFAATAFLSIRAEARGTFQALPLQSAGQASFAIDEGARAAYIIDLGSVGDGQKLLAGRNGALFEGKPLIDYLVEDRKIEHLVVVCSHPHADHAGGIKELFRNAPRWLLGKGESPRSRFKTVSTIDNGVSNSLAKIYSGFADQMRGAGLEFRSISVTGSDGQPRDAFAELPFEQQDIRIANVPYAQSEPADVHGRAVITFTRLDPAASASGILDPDDASTTAIEAAVARLKVQGVTAIDSFIVPHHGSRYHDSEAILSLGPKRAIVSVNPDNYFGHPAAEVIEKLIDRLGPENVLFTGSVGAVEIGLDGVKALHSAADPDTFALFFEQRLAKAERLPTTKARNEEIAALKRVRAKILDRSPARPGALDTMIAARAQATGTIHPSDFEAGLVPLKDGHADLLAASRLFTVTAAVPAVYVTADHSLSDEDSRKVWQSQGAVDIRVQADTGLPSAYFPDVLPPAPSNGGDPGAPLRPHPGGGGATTVSLGSDLLPDGGMVFLDGGRVEIAGAQSEMTGARLAVCGAAACLTTLTGASYRLPFTNMALFGEVLWRVNRGTKAFYLSINPRKKLLQANFPITQVPSGRLRFGPGHGGADALNDVVTTGGIDRSRIGDILWRADVEFKSKALGLDALSGVARPADSRLLFSGDAKGEEDDAVAEADRWCRLYWGSGTPKISFTPPSGVALGRVTFAGSALKANAEAMVPRAGKLQPAPFGGWCAREKAVARALERDANAASAGTLGELRTLAQMQSFALWAERSGVITTDLATLPAPIAAIPGWTSGIRTATTTVVKPERNVASAAPGAKRGYNIHVWSSNPAADGCAWRVWSAFDHDMAALQMPRQNGAWVVDAASYPKLDVYVTQASARIAKCTGGRAEPVSNNPDIDINQRVAATIAAPRVHSLSSQLHGGVLLAEEGEKRAFEHAYGDKGILWSPDGTLLFKRIGESLHFWNRLAGERGLQHVVVTRGTLMNINADEGGLMFEIQAQPGAVVRSDLRARGMAISDGFEWMGLWHGADGAPLIGKVAAHCAAGDAPAGCVDVRELSDDALPERLEAIGLDPALQVVQIGDEASWVVRMDIRRLAAKLRPAGDADADARIAAVGMLGRWGFRDEALGVLAGALDAVSPDAEDTLLRSLALGSE